MTFSAPFYHGILSPERTEELLVEDKSYLARRSPLNPDKYILSYFVNNHVKHEIVESSSEKKRKKVSLQDVVEVINEMVHSNPCCENAVVSLRRKDSPPPGDNQHHQGCRSRNDEDTQEAQENGQAEVCGDQDSQGCRFQLSPTNRGC